MPVCSVVGLRFVTRKAHVVGSCPVRSRSHQRFLGVLAKTRGIFLSFLDIRGRRQIFLAAFSFSFGVDSAWGVSAAFHGMWRHFGNFQKEQLYYNFEGAKTLNFVRVKGFFSAKVNPPRRWANFLCDRTLCFDQLDAAHRSVNTTASFLVWPGPNMKRGLKIGPLADNKPIHSVWR